MTKIAIGSKVKISTHGDNLGTVIDIIEDPVGEDRIVVHMDGEPGPRHCLKRNVFPLEIKSQISL